MSTTERLRALLDGRTPGPWKTTGRRGRRDGYVRSDGVGMPERTVADVRYRNGDADAALIVAAVNALPALLDVVDAAQAWRDKPYATNADPEWIAVVAALDRLDSAS